MNNLHFREYFKNYLYDLENFITIYEGNLHVFNYIKLDKLSDKEIKIEFNKYKINITGSNLRVNKMTKEELLINGRIMKVEFKYE